MRFVRLALGSRSIVALLLSCATIARAQEPSRPTPPSPSDVARCDSIVAAARVDSVQAAVFISVRRWDGGDLSPELASIMSLTVGAEFVPPKPIRLSVFSGSSRPRFLRAASDTLADLRAPTISGRYRFWAKDSGVVTNISTVRASLIPGFDSAAVLAIRAAAVAKAFVPPTDDDSMLVDVHLSTDSTAGAQRMIAAVLPRMPVVDAVVRPGNPAAVFPDQARQDSVPSGDVVLRFVVDRDGLPAMETVELVRGGQQVAFVRSALAALPAQKFVPATIHGCAVAQVVEYAFTFINPDAPPRH